MFPVTPITLPQGLHLVVVAGSLVTFNVDQMLGNLTTLTTFEYNFDWGDGSTSTGVRTPLASTTTHQWDQPGRYTVQLQALIGGAVQTGSWTVEVALPRAEFGAATGLPWVAAAQGSLVGANGEVRHALLLLPELSRVEPGSDVGVWGATTLIPTLAQVTQATELALARWQAAYAFGFGRLPMPRAPIGEGIWAHFAQESLPVGTSTVVGSAFDEFERIWRELTAAGDDPRWLEQLATAVAAATANLPTPALTALTPLSWPGTGDYLGAGPGSVRMADVMRWLEYRLAEIDDDQTSANVPVWAWRRQVGQAAPDVPAVDPQAAWCWEVAQAAMQTVAAFMGALGAQGNTERCAALVLANPANGQVSLRVVDAMDGMWSMLQVGPGDQELQDSDLVAEGGARAGSAVAARGQTVASLSGTAQLPPNPWNPQRVAEALSPNAQLAYPTYDLTSLTTPELVDSQQGSDVVHSVGPQGSVRRARSVVLSGGHTLGIADVCRPSLPLPDPLHFRSGMRPHALLALLGGLPSGSRAAPNSMQGNAARRLPQLRSRGSDSGDSNSTPLARTLRPR